MKHKKTLAAAALIGLVAVAGCSRGGFPENNEANYNGERLVRSVTRRVDDVSGHNREYNREHSRTRGVTRNDVTRSSAPRDNVTRSTGRALNPETKRKARRYTATDNTRGLNNQRRYDAGRKEHTFELNRDRVNSRAHRLDRTGAENITLNDSRYGFEQTVPVISIDDDNDNMAINGRVAEFFAARRNRQHNHNHNPETAPEAPETPEATPVPETEENKAPDTLPEPTEPETTQKPETHPVKVSPKAKRAMK
jgi:hypothetical protein